MNAKRETMRISHPRNIVTTTCGLMSCLLLPAVLFACSVPVFRYALEHWRPDAYQVVVYHDKDLTEEQESLLTNLRKQGSSAGAANLQVRLIDLRQDPSETDLSRWQLAGEPDLPAMVVNLPGRIGGGDVMVGVSAWNEEEVKSLVDSPARVELAERLIQGHVVWIFIDGGQKDEDDARLAILETEINRLQESLDLPAIEQDDLNELSIDADELSIRFSTIRVGRDDPKEKWFLDMLLSIEPDLRDEELAGEPMVIPVFGRGRALYALVGLGINPDVIKEAAEFLTGACQCTVKAENPGVDLLMPVRWDDFVVPTEPEEVSLPLVGLGNYPPPDSSSVENELVAIADDKLSPDIATTVEPKESESFASDPAVADLESSGTIISDSLGQQQSTVTVWLPWAVLLVLGTVIGLASLSMFRRH